MNIIKDRVEELKKVHAIQGSNGNWDYDEYMLGLFNGLEMALSIMEDREPEFRNLKKYNINKRLEELKNKCFDELSMDDFLYIIQFDKEFKTFGRLVIDAVD